MLVGGVFGLVMMGNARWGRHDLRESGVSILITFQEPDAWAFLSLDKVKDACGNRKRRVLIRAEASSLVPRRGGLALDTAVPRATSTVEVALWWSLCSTNHNRRRSFIPLVALVYAGNKEER